MPIDWTTKGADIAGITLGSIEAPLLELVDTRMAKAAVDAGTYAQPENYPLYFRPGIVIPIATGIPCLLAGLFGDKLLKDHPNWQLGLLSYGMTALIGGLTVLIRALQARNAVGVPMLLPKPTDTSGKTYNVPRASSYIVPPAESTGGGGATTAPSPYVPPSDTVGEVSADI